MIFDAHALKGEIRRRFPAFGSVISGLSFEEKPGLARTGSDGKTVFFNGKFMEALTWEEQLFFLVHEICHLAFGHIRRGRGKDPLIWKTATDAVINQMLKRDGLEIPDGETDYPEAIDYSAEEYYEILLREKLEIELVSGRMDSSQTQGSSGKSDGSGEEDGSGPAGEEDPGEGGEPDSEEKGTDEHELWEDADQAQRQEEEEREEELRKELEKIKELSEAGSPDDLPEQDQDDLQEEEGEENILLEEKISQGGNDVSPGMRKVESVGRASPLLDWRLILRDSVNYGVDWSMEHAVLDHGIVRPVLEERPAPETEIVLDTSWSVDDELLRNFLRECRNILQISRLFVGCFDTVFYGFHEIRTDDDIETMSFEGGGGTDFEAAVGAFSLRVDNRIIFTDGEAEMPEEPFDAIWMVYGEKEIAPEGGRVIRIPTGELR